jgi:hypothetical protein
MTWREFLTSHADAIIACDFLHIDTVGLERLYELVFLQHGTRRLHIAGVTSHPTAAWAAQQARNVACDLEIRLESLRFLIRDRDSKCTESFDAVFQAEDLETLKMPPRAPRANAHCERIIGTLRREVLDNLLILNEAHAHRVSPSTSGTTTSIARTGLVTSYRRTPPSNPPACTTSKAADSCALESSAASSTSTDTYPELQR